MISNVNSRKKVKVVSPVVVMWAVVLIIVLFLASSIFVFSAQYNQGADWLERTTGFSFPRVAKPSPFVLGLDLKGGAHLVYEADVSKIPSAEQADAVDGVRDVIERRINSLGVAEPIIQTNHSGDSYRIIVELAGVSNVQEAIDAIGETPILEFKEVSDKPPRGLTTEEKEKLVQSRIQEKNRAQTLLEKISKGEKFDDIARASSEDINTKDNGGLVGFIKEEGVFKDLIQPLKKFNTSTLYTSLVHNDEGWNIVKLNALDKNGEEFGVAHIMVCHKDSTQGCETKRTKQEAQTKAEEIYNAILNDKRKLSLDVMKEFALKFSDEPTVKEKQGDLGFLTIGQLAPSLEDAILNVDKGVLTKPSESEFGYHLFFKYAERPLTLYNISRILIQETQESTILPQNERWQSTGLSGQQLERAELQFDQQSTAAVVAIQFDEEGKKLFADLTKRNIGKPIAIFLDGQPISIPQVSEAIPTGNAIIQGNFTLESAKQLAQRLNAGALPVPVELVSQSTVGASLGSATFEKSIKAALIGFLLVVLFMILYYRLPGLISAFSLVVYTLLVLSVFKILPVTLTAASIAGFVLSMGMAIDANILVFERVKEELQAGKSLSYAIEEGFNRAWFAIRASNMSSAITAIILIYLSSSVVKGFAVTLLIGIAMSIFSAVTVTRYLMRFVIQKTALKPLWYLGAPHHTIDVQQEKNI